MAKLIENVDYKEIDHKYYKYELLKEQSVYTGIPGYTLDTPHFSLRADGLLTGKIKYAWNGASGGCPDWKCILRGSLFHDILYQILIEKLLSKFSGFKFQNVRAKADKLLYNLCIEDKMWKWVAWSVYKVVRAAGKSFAKG